MLGDKARFPKDIQKLMYEIEEKSEGCSDYHLNVAVNYGGQQDITQACKKLAERVEKGELKASEYNEKMIQENLYTGSQPPLDLVIRTSFEHRVSNFLLWQLAYAELVFLKIHWPEFDEKALEMALNIYKGRERRFGAIEE